MINMSLYRCICFYIPELTVRIDSTKQWGSLSLYKDSLATVYDDKFLRTHNNDIYAMSKIGMAISFTITCKMSII